MRIVIAGGHGQIALLLSRLLAAAGHEPVGLIRDPAQAADLSAAGAASAVLDLEVASVDELAGVLRGADAAVFAAGAGPSSGPERKLSLDREGAILLADAAVASEVRRLVVISSMGADAGIATTPDSDVFDVYLRAKGEADDAVRSRDLEWTVIRPGALTDDPPTGHVSAGEHVGRGSIPRADVAAVVAHVLTESAAIERTFELIGGDRLIADAVAALG